METITVSTFVQRFQEMHGLQIIQYIWLNNRSQFQVQFSTGRSETFWMSDFEANGLRLIDDPVDYSHLKGIDRELHELSTMGYRYG